MPGLARLASIGVLQLIMVPGIQRRSIFKVNKDRDNLRWAEGGVLRKERKGRSVMYCFDERCPYLEEIVGMQRKLYDGTFVRLKKRIFDPVQTP